MEIELKKKQLSFIVYCIRICNETNNCPGI